MAKKKAKKGTTRRRRSSRNRIGGVDTGAIVNLIAAGVGYIGGNLLDKVIPIDNPMLKNGGKLAVALLIPKAIKGPMGQALAIGIGANAVSKTLVGFVPALGAVDDDVVMLQGVDTLGEAEYVETLSGLPSVAGPTISGIEEYLMASGTV